MEKQPILIIYDDGSADVPLAKTIGELLAVFKLTARIIAGVKRDVMAMPIIHGNNDDESL